MSTGLTPRGGRSTLVRLSRAINAKAKASAESTTFLVVGAPGGAAGLDSDGFVYDSMIGPDITRDEEMAAYAQPLNALLSGLSPLTTSADKVIYATGSNVFSTTTLNASGRSLIGTTIAADQVPYGNGTATYSTTPLVASGRSMIGLAIAADQIPYGSGTGTYSTTPLTAYARTLVDDATAADARTTLGLNDIQQGTGISIPAAVGGVVQVNIDSTVVTLTGAQAIVGKTSLWAGASTADGTATTPKIYANGTTTSTNFSSVSALSGYDYVGVEYNNVTPSYVLMATQATSFAALVPSSGYHATQGKVLGAFRIFGTYDDRFANSANFFAIATEDWSANTQTASGTRWQWSVTQNTTATRFQALTIDHDGTVYVGASPDTLASTTASRSWSSSALKPVAMFATKSTMTFTSSFANPTLPIFSTDRAVYVLGATAPGSNAKVGYHHAPTLKNDPLVSPFTFANGVNFLGRGFYDQPGFRIDTITGASFGIYAAFVAAGNYDSTSAGTFTAGQWRGLYTNLTVNQTTGTGNTLTSVTHAYFTDVAGTATVTTQNGVFFNGAWSGAATQVGISMTGAWTGATSNIGIDIGAFAGAGTNIGVRSKTHSRFTSTLTIGADAAVGAGLTLDVQGNASITGTFVVTGHDTLEGVTSTGATGTLKHVYSDSPTFTTALTAASPTFTGHVTMEGVTSTGATGTGKQVYDTAPTFASDVTLPRTFFSASTITLANGDNDGVTVPTGASIVYVTGPTAAFAIRTFSTSTTPTNMFLWIVNLTGFNMTMKNETATPTAGRITTMTGGDVATTGNGAFLVHRDAGTSRWVVLMATL